MRKALVFVIGLLIVAAVPANAIIGFCARLPCCSSHEDHGVAIDNTDAGCCDTIKCAETPPHELAPVTAVKSFIATVAVVPQATAVIPSAPEPSAREYHDLAPPPLTARERLSALSLLLI